MKKKLTVILTGLFLIFGIVVFANADTKVTSKSAQILLGQTLYNETALSINNNQSCATCHNPSAKAPNTVASFVDDRIIAVTGLPWPAGIPLPVSQGSDLTLFGGRNAPSAAYAAFSPAFRFDEVIGLYVGGQFWDGREMNLAGQAAGPPRNPVEMALADKKAVIGALQGIPAYQVLFEDAYEIEFGIQYDLSAVALDNQSVLEAYDLMAKAIGEFEKTQDFNKFNSRYDYFLAGLGTLTKDEGKGLKLFEGQGKCALCHISQQSIAPDGGAMPPLFTDFTYDNLGIPKNWVIETLAGPQSTDLGLGGVLGDPAQDGKFKVMTLRNIELTAPYGHNGFFPTLESIVHFYNTRDKFSCANGGTPVTPANLGAGILPPASGTCWPAPEVLTNMNTAELGDLGLVDKDERQIVAFLKTLTDRPITGPDAVAPVFPVTVFPPMP